MPPFEEGATSNAAWTIQGMDFKRDLVPEIWYSMLARTWARRRIFFSGWALGLWRLIPTNQIRRSFGSVFLNGDGARSRFALWARRSAHPTVSRRSGLTSPVP